MRWVLVLLLVAGCSGDPDPTLRNARAEKVKARAKAAEAVLSVTPQPRTYRLDAGELKVLDVPAADSSGFLETHKCFVWRDIEFKTSSISCSHQPDMLLGIDTPN